MNACDSGTCNRVICALILSPLIAVPAVAGANVKDASVCEIDSHLWRYASKVVRVRGRVERGFEWFFISDGECKLDLGYPPGQAELGPAAAYQEYPEPKPRAKFKVQRDEQYKRFVEYINAPARLKGGCYCLACSPYEVTATIVGLIEVARPKRPGFGHLNAARARLVIRSVSDVNALDRLSKYETSSCGLPEFALPSSLYPGWNQPASVPAFPDSGSDQK